MANTLGSIIVNLLANTTSFLDGMDRASVVSKKTAKDIEGAFSGLGGTLEKVLSPLGNIGAEIGSALGEAGQSAAKLATSLGSLGGVAGVAGAAVGGLAAAAVALGAA